MCSELLSPSKCACAFNRRRSCDVSISLARQSVEISCCAFCCCCDAVSLRLMSPLFYLVITSYAALWRWRFALVSCIVATVVVILQTVTRNVLQFLSLLLVTPVAEVLLTQSIVPNPNLRAGCRERWYPKHPSPRTPHFVRWTVQRG